MACSDTDGFLNSSPKDNGCSDTDDGAQDKDGYTCATYTQIGESHCGGKYDDDDFRSDEMCCKCGGGETAERGRACASYTQSPNYCGGHYDDDDFRSGEMCCACGGGEPVGKSSTTETHCVDTNDMEVAKAACMAKCDEIGCGCVAVSANDPGTSANPDAECPKARCALAMDPATYTVGSWGNDQLRWQGLHFLQQQRQLIAQRRLRPAQDDEPARAPARAAKRGGVRGGRSGREKARERETRDARLVAHSERSPLERSCVAAALSGW